MDMYCHTEMNNGDVSRLVELRAIEVINVVRIGRDVFYDNREMKRTDENTRGREEMGFRDLESQI